MWTFIQLLNPHRFNVNTYPSQSLQIQVYEAIILMLDHCRTNTGTPINYIPYAHFEEEIGGTVKPIDLPTLKEILTFKEAKVRKYYHTDNAITDTQLSAFLAQFKLILATALSSAKDL
jgi:hypothetical protein